MDRRGFLRGLGIFAGGLALNEAIPPGRVWSFPKEIVVPQYLTPAMITRECLRILDKNARFIESVNSQYDANFATEGRRLQIRMPVQYLAA